MKGKRVAVVGSSATTLGSGQGRAIDSYDLVVRFNDAIEHMPFENGRAEDIGTRADIIYSNQVVLRENIHNHRGLSSERLIGVCGEVGVKYVVCTNNGLSYDNTGTPNRTCSRGDEHVIDDCRRFFHGNGTTPGFRLVRAASEVLGRWLQGNFGRTGFVAIVDLLSFDVSRLYITGMTFYHGGGHLFPQSAEDLHPLKNRDGTWARDRSGLGHDSYLELDAMRVLARCFRRRLALDEPLQQLLNQSR